MTMRRPDAPVPPLRLPLNSGAGADRVVTTRRRTDFCTMKTISPTAAADTSPPPLKPEEKPIVVHDHGMGTGKRHDIDTAAGDEGIDDEVGDDFDNNGGREK